MNFFGEARRAGAAEYGRVRAERYGRRARFGAAVMVVLCVLLAVGIVVAARGGFGG